MKERYDLSARFVAPLPEPRTRVEVIEVQRDLPPAPSTVLMPTANYTDRARGYSIAAGPLAAATGLVVVLIGISAFGVPLLSVAALLLALAGFTVTWAITFIIHTFVSPDGALFLHTVFIWRLLRAEQKERFERYGLKGHDYDRK